MNAYITSRLGIVHRMLGGTTTCPSGAGATKHVPVTPAQAMVYPLTRCPSCWPNDDTYRGWVHGRAAA